jgi:hypothetical protein
MKFINGLPAGWTWVYSAGDGYKGRHAKNILSGETLSMRGVQKAQHEGIRYEKRKPVETRRKYRARVKDITFQGTRYKVYTSPHMDVIEGVMEQHKKARGWLVAHGRTTKTVTSDRIRNMITWAALSSMFDLGSYERNTIVHRGMDERLQQFKKSPDRYAVWIVQG